MGERTRVAWLTTEAQRAAEGMRVAVRPRGARVDRLRHCEASERRSNPGVNTGRDCFLGPCGASSQ